VGNVQPQQLNADYDWETRGAIAGNQEIKTQKESSLEKTRVYPGDRNDFTKARQRWENRGREKKKRECFH